MGLGSSLFVMIGWFLVVVCGLGLLITLLFGTFWADRRATPGTVVQREQRLL